MPVFFPGPLCGGTWSPQRSKLRVMLENEFGVILWFIGTWSMYLHCPCQLLTIHNLGVSWNGVLLIAGWFTMENLNRTWMIWGYPHGLETTIFISADPCRQQGERVREEITSNKCCAVQVRGKRGGTEREARCRVRSPKKEARKEGQSQRT